MAKAEKIFVLGVDGLDPRLSRKLVDEGKMPHMKQFIERGACREDLVLMGAMPTITPPMWTTLATGAYPNTHGITCFWNQHPEKLDTLVYAFDSRECKAEQMWNVTAESGKKTLVWHWPGASWPPSSKSENLHVIEGTQPPMVHGGVGEIDGEVFTMAKIDCPETRYVAGMKSDSGAGCVLSDVKIADQDDDDMSNILNAKQSTNVIFSHMDGEGATETTFMLDQYETPLAEPKNWQIEVPEGAKEFSILVSNGVRKLVCLLLKDNEGDYSQVAIYKNKKTDEPLAFLNDKGEFMQGFIDEVPIDGEIKRAHRFATIMQIDHAGTMVQISVGHAMNIDLDPELWSPKRLYSSVVSNVGPVPGAPTSGAGKTYIMERRNLPEWDVYVKWQSDAIHYLMEQEGYEVVFSHIHNVDLFGHLMYRWLKSRSEYDYQDEAPWQGYLEALYHQTDEYLGSFLHLLDEGWTVLIVSDHGGLCPNEDEVPLIGEGFGLNVGVMRDLGYTVMLKNDKGEDIKKVDWSQTKAVAPRGNHIYINLKGRDATGIVEPEDKYDLEAQIISDLYNYRIDGKRVIQLAVRNKEAAVFGMGGAGMGDIIYFVEEGFNRLHGDSWPTLEGYCHTSVQPIFIAAGKGIKPGYTDRVIREVDVTPTIADLLGLRMPHQCEGAPAYQIIEQ